MWVLKFFVGGIHIPLPILNIYGGRFFLILIFRSYATAEYPCLKGKKYDSLIFLLTVAKLTASTADNLTMYRSCDLLKIKTNSFWWALFHLLCYRTTISVCFCFFSQLRNINIKVSNLIQIFLSGLLIRRVKHIYYQYQGTPIHMSLDQKQL